MEAPKIPKNIPIFPKIFPYSQKHSLFVEMLFMEMPMSYICLCK